MLHWTDPHFDDPEVVRERVGDLSGFAKAAHKYYRRQEKRERRRAALKAAVKRILRKIHF